MAQKNEFEAKIFKLSLMHPAVPGLGKNPHIIIFCTPTVVHARFFSGG